MSKNTGDITSCEDFSSNTLPRKHCEGLHISKCCPEVVLELEIKTADKAEFVFPEKSEIGENPQTDCIPKIPEEKEGKRLNGNGQSAVSNVPGLRPIGGAEAAIFDVSEPNRRSCSSDAGKPGAVLVGNTGIHSEQEELASMEVGAKKSEDALTDSGEYLDAYSDLPASEGTGVTLQFSANDSDAHSDHTYARPKSFPDIQSGKVTALAYSDDQNESETGCGDDDWHEDENFGMLDETKAKLRRELGKRSHGRRHTSEGPHGDHRDSPVWSNQSADRLQKPENSAVSPRLSDGEKLCFRCNNPGHLVRECTALYGHRRNKIRQGGKDLNRCYYCHQTGHYKADCVKRRHLAK